MTVKEDRSKMASLELGGAPERQRDIIMAKVGFGEWVTES